MESQPFRQTYNKTGKIILQTKGGNNMIEIINVNELKDFGKQLQQIKTAVDNLNISYQKMLEEQKKRMNQVYGASAFNIGKLSGSYEWFMGALGHSHTCKLSLEDWTTIMNLTCRSFGVESPCDIPDEKVRAANLFAMDIADRACTVLYHDSETEVKNLWIPEQLSANHIYNMFKASQKDNDTMQHFGDVIAMYPCTKVGNAPYIERAIVLINVRTERAVYDLTDWFNPQFYYIDGVGRPMDPPKKKTLGIIPK